MKIKFFIIINFLYFIYSYENNFQCSSPQKYDNLNLMKLQEEGTDEWFIFLHQILIYLSQHSNENLVVNYMKNNIKCLEKIYFNTNIDELFFMISSSGKMLLESGNEMECKRNNYTYLFLDLTINVTEFYNDSDNKYIYNYLEQNKTFIGICLWPECQTFYDLFLDSKQNENFFQFLNEQGIKDLIYRKKEDYNPTIIVLIFFWFSIAYICFKTIISIFSAFFLQNKQEIRRRSDSSLNSDPFEDGKLILQPNKEKVQEDTKFMQYLKVIYSFFSIKKDYKYMTSIKNKYYDDTNMEIFTSLRFIAVFWLTYNQNIYTLIRIPQNEFTNAKFYNSILFSFVKYSIFSVDIWILLEGMIYSYKLMSYLKKQTQNSLGDGYSFKLFFDFYKRVIIRFPVFLILFFLYSVPIREFGYLFKSKTQIFDYYISHVFGKRYCVYYPWTVLVPFYLQYMPGRDFTNCFRFVNIYLNQFYCITIITLVFYLSFKLKSKKFDYSFSIFIFLNLIFSFLSYDIKAMGHNYTFINGFLGDNESQRYTHLYLITYTMGIFVGMVHFYYMDLISQNPMNSEGQYIPFDFNYSIVKIIDTSSTLKKRFCISLGVLMQILVSMSLYIYINFFNKTIDKDNKNDYEKLEIEVTPYLFYIYVYERKIFLFSFILVFLCLDMSNNKYNSVKNIVSSYIVIPLNRINFSYMCIINTSIYLFYSESDFQIYLNFQNIFLITLGLVTVFMYASALIFILYELPVRKFYKRFISELN